MGEDRSYEALWVKPDLKKEVRDEDGRNDTERLKHWNAESREKPSKSIDRSHIESIVEEKIQELKQRGII